MVRILDIAQELGVSPATVSNALNGQKNISEEMRQQVLAACERMGYRHTVTRAKRERNRSILFVFSDFDRNFYLNIIKGINDCLNQNGYDLMICTPRSCERFMNPRVSAGAIVLDAAMSDAQLLAGAGAHYPIVAMDRVLSHEHIKSVVVNNRAAMSALVQALVDGKYKRFGYLGGPEHTLDHVERYEAFTNTLADNGINFSKRFYFHGDYRDKSGYQAAKLMLLSNAVPQVLVSANDSMAIGALRAIRDAGLTVPGDISVTGFDGTGTAEALGLTTVAIPRYETGYLAAGALLSMLEGDGAGEPVYISASPVLRATTLLAPETPAR